jgi:hypothetical protein
MWPLKSATVLGGLTCAVDIAPPKLSERPPTTLHIAIVGQARSWSTYDRKVWKVGPHKRGGMNSPEHANHFADMDRVPNPKLSEGATWLQFATASPATSPLMSWRHHYDACKSSFQLHESWGLLPFRVWQIYDAMALIRAERRCRALSRRVRGTVLSRSPLDMHEM